MTQSRVTFARLTPLLVFIAVWEGGARSLASPLLPSPITVVAAWWHLAAGGVLLDASILSIKRVLVGFTIAATAAGLLAIGMARFPLLRINARVAVELLRHIAPIAWIPLAILWFQLGDRPAYFIVFLGSFFPILLNVLHGIQSVSPRHVEVARVLGASSWMLWTEVMWPAVKPDCLTGLRIGLGVGWMSLIAAELVGVQLGLGYLIQINRLSLHMDNVVAVMLTIGVLGLAMNQGLLAYARRTTPWGRDVLPL